MRKAALTLLAATAMSLGSLVIGPTAGADVRDPFDPYGVGGYGGIGHPGYGVGGLGPVAGPVGPIGVGGVIGPVGVDPVARAAVDTVAVDDAIHYAIPYDYPLAPAFPGEVPCFTPSGEAYYTPGADPCVCFAPTGAAVPC
ncbi:MAG: hypothetical protein ACOYB7_18365 [Mycobacterium sp.]